MRSQRRDEHDRATSHIESSSVDPVSMPIGIRLQLVQLTSELGEKEADRTWTRYNIMLTLNAGLIAIISYALSQSLYLLVISIGIFGVFLSVFFYRIIGFSQFYEARWRSDMSSLINADPILRDSLRSRSEIGPRERKPYRGSSTGDAKRIVLAVAAFWIALILYSASHLLKYHF